MSSTDESRGAGYWRAIAESDAFTTLLRERRRATLALGAISLGWYALFLILVVYAEGFMSRAVFADELTVAYVLGLSQFVVTFVVIRIYTRLADGRFAELERRVADEITAAGPAATASEPAAAASPPDADTTPPSEPGSWPGGPR